MKGTTRGETDIRMDGRGDHRGAGERPAVWRVVTTTPSYCSPSPPLLLLLLLLSPRPATFPSALIPIRGQKAAPERGGSPLPPGFLLAPGIARDDARSFFSFDEDYAARVTGLDIKRNFLRP